MTGGHGPRPGEKVATSARDEPRRPARERLLEAASELFYNEGVQTVGIDRIIEHAGVAKASLYNTFGSKEELVRAYLENRHAGTTKRLLAAVDAHTDPRERLLAIFDAQGELFAQNTFRGCAFATASAEAPRGGLVEQAADDYRADIRELLTRLARDAGAADRTISTSICRAEPATCLAIGIATTRYRRFRLPPALMSAGPGKSKRQAPPTTNRSLPTEISITRCTSAAAGGLDKVVLSGGWGYSSINPTHIRQSLPMASQVQIFTALVPGEAWITFISRMAGRRSRLAEIRMSRSRRRPLGTTIYRGTRFEGGLDNIAFYGSAWHVDPVNSNNYTTVIADRATAGEEYYAARSGGRLDYIYFQAGGYHTESLGAGTYVSLAAEFTRQENFSCP